jgi:short-subunit dehydrogenase
VSEAHGLRVWITGASSGIGAAVATELARRGARVAVTARSLERLAVVAEHGDVSVFAGDVTDRDRMAQIASQIVEQWGGIDIVVLNAGTYRPLPIDEFTSDEVRATFEVNVMGIVHCIEAVLPRMRADRHGRIALMSSVTAFAGFPLAAAYGSTKAYIANMGESLRADLADSGVDISVVFPGFVATELTGQNAFSMPWIIPAEEAARIITDGLLRGRDEIAVPWRPFLAARAFAAMPGPVRRRALRSIARRRRSDSS